MTNDHTDKSLFELRQYAVEKDREIERLREALEKIEKLLGDRFPDHELVLDSSGRSTGVRLLVEGAVMGPYGIAREALAKEPNE